jgi:hypothetical protein
MGCGRVRPDDPCFEGGAGPDLDQGGSGAEIAGIAEWKGPEAGEAVQEKQAGVADAPRGRAARRAFPCPERRGPGALPDSDESHPGPEQRRLCSADVAFEGCSCSGGRGPRRRSGTAARQRIRKRGGPSGSSPAFARPSQSARPVPGQKAHCPRRSPVDGAGQDPPRGEDAVAWFIISAFRRRVPRSKKGRHDGVGAVGEETGIRLQVEPHIFPIA